MEITYVYTGKDIPRFLPAEIRTGKEDGEKLELGRLKWGISENTLARTCIYGCFRYDAGALGL